MATREEVNEIVIQLMASLWSCRKDKIKEPKAYARVIELYFDAFSETPRMRLFAAMQRALLEFEGPFWPTPATIRKFMPVESATTSKGGWTAMPARWKWDARLPELRRMCEWAGDGDPLVALANALAAKIATDPWRCMRNAMVTKAGPGHWEKFGEDSYPCYSPEAVKVARNLVEEAGRKSKVRVDLSGLSLEQIEAAHDSAVEA